MKKLLLPLVALAALLLARTACADFVYNDFSDVSNLQLNGAATQVDNHLQLTTTDLFVGGSVFTTDLTPLGNLNTFSTNFQFQISDASGVGDEDGPGADGLTFTVQTQANNVGSLGGGLGYAGIRPSLGIEFDTYNNPEDSDPDGNHVGIDLNGSLVSIATTHEPERFNDGQVWNVWIDYDGNTNTLEVRWSLTTDRPVDPQLSATVNLTQLFGQNTGYVGFTAATGNGYQVTNILNWQYKNSFFAPMPPSITSTDSASGTVQQALTYQVTSTDPAATYTATDLPPGLSLDAASGIISGIPTAVGTVNATITATNTVGSNSVNLTFFIDAGGSLLPVITSPTAAVGQATSQFVYQITATQAPTFYEADTLPAGLTLNPSTGLITGFPQAAATTNSTIAVSNTTGTTFFNLIFYIEPKDPNLPIITSDDSANGQVGKLFDYQISALNSPTSYAAAGLPLGLTFDSVNGIISGAPTQAGQFYGILSATNAAGRYTVIFSLLVQPSQAAPVVYGGGRAAFQVSQPLRYAVSASGPGTITFGARGLPPGLSINPANGVISGVPSVPGESKVILDATNQGGTSSAILDLVIFATPTVTLDLIGAGQASPGGKKGKVLVTRSGDLSAGLVVFFKTKGSAVNGEDYELLDHKVVFLPGQATAKVKVRPFYEAGAASGQTVQITLKKSPSGSYAVGETKSATIAIVR